MVEKINDGGTAFPMRHSVFPSGAIECGSPGMSLRDYLAAAAMQGMLSIPDGRIVEWEYLSEQSYEAADAMLAARERKEG
ncbi:MAG: hypothetical protein RIR25_1930 [Verrucomicrobiota bacterium]|jgi:hypothetical protein